MSGVYMVLDEGTEDRVIGLSTEKWVAPFTKAVLGDAQRGIWRCWREVFVLEDVGDTTIEGTIHIHWFALRRDDFIEVCGQVSLSPCLPP